MIEFNEEKHEKKLREIRLKEEEDLAQQFSEKYGIPYINLALRQVNTDALRLISEKKARAAHLVPFTVSGSKLSIATTTPEHEETLRALDNLRKQGYSLKLYLTSNHGLEHAWDVYGDITPSTKTESGVLDIANAEIQEYAEKLNRIEDIQQMVAERLEGAQKYEITRLLEIFIAGALGTHVSDIHLEPREEDIMLRLRLDGVLHEVLTFEHKIYNLLSSRIKLLSEMKINVEDDAQDGRFSIRFGERGIEIRASTTPGAYGESIVLRILDPEAIRVGFEDLGIEPHLLQMMEQEIRKPHGMVITTGPTGSGKTTTLYAFLRQVSTPENKIITIEDPVEYHIEEITQTQVDREADYTFLKGLRSALRQDPDVIMVGEIRDEDTARTAVNAALTGHIVFTTLHTNTAAGAFPRLVDLGANPKTIGSALNIVLAQRLVRKLCDECKQETESSPDERRTIDALLSALPENTAVQISQDSSRIWKPGKCDTCNNTGYKGRIGIFEAIQMDKAIEDAIVRKPSEREVQRAAQPQGIPTLAQDGIIKVLKGVTSLEELARVVELAAPEQQ